MNRITAVLAIVGVLSAFAITAIAISGTGIGDGSVSSNVRDRSNITGGGDGHPGYVYAAYGYKPYTVPYAYKPYRNPYAPYAARALKTEQSK